MASETIPDLEGWEAYCENCRALREARRAQERDVADDTEYFEFVCNVCHSILLTFQKLGTQSAEAKPARPVLTTRCPHCGDLNIIAGFDQILAYVCQHCGQGVGISPPMQ